MSNELGKYLRQLRGDMSLRDFAAKCNISHTHLDSIEKGADPRTKKPVSISTETLRLIADGLNENYLVLACLADGIDPLNVINIDLSKYCTHIKSTNPEKYKMIVANHGLSGPNIVSELSDDAIQFEEAYNKADPGIKASVCKLLDLDSSQQKTNLPSYTRIAARGGGLSTVDASAVNELGEKMEEEDTDI